MGKTIIPDKNAKAPEEKRYRRFVTHGDRQVEVEVKTPSKEAVNALGMRTRRKIFGDIAINPPWIERNIAVTKAKLMRELAHMHPKERMRYLREHTPIDFVEDKQAKGYHQYNITCVNCGDQVAVVWAKDDTLKDWCDLHYMCEHDKNTWRGAMAVNVSPIDGLVGFECACGEDTRDFRANKELPRVMKQLMIEYSNTHRGFGHAKAGFVAMKKE